MTPAIRSEYGRRRYLYTAVSECNGLPSELRKLGYLSFKRELREQSSMAAGARRLRCCVYEMWLV